MLVKQHLATSQAQGRKNPQTKVFGIISKVSRKGGVGGGLLIRRQHYCWVSFLKTLKPKIKNSKTLIENPRTLI